MFTGLIQQCGFVVDSRATSGGAVVRIGTAGWSHRSARGDSIAVNGCCLTVRDVCEDSGLLSFDVIHETLNRTTLGALAGGAAVNLEHAVTPHTLLGGHIVQGHVDGVATVLSVNQVGGEYRIRVGLPEELRRYTSMKGSIAIDGVSLTIAALHDDGFDVALIPTTLELTTLDSLRETSRVNIEVDYIAKLVLQSIQRTQIDLLARSDS